MKKFLSVCLFVLIAACSKAESQTQPVTPTDNTNIDKDTVFSFDINTLTPGCNSESQMICAINASIKCTINPDFAECAELKAFMPNFVFMRDESLQRPTSQSYKISKIKPLSDGTLEVYTQSTCNGNWFGLCNGNIIYVMDNQNGNWAVKDIYAVEI